MEATTDNFQWTDELAKELCEYVGMRVGKDKDIRQQVELLTEDFKQSKVKKDKDGLGNGLRSTPYSNKQITKSWLFLSEYIRSF